MNTLSTKNHYRPDCTKAQHFAWAAKQIAFFVIPCLVLAASGVMIAKQIAPTEIKLHASDED